MYAMENARYFAREYVYLHTCRQAEGARVANREDTNKTTSTGRLSTYSRSYGMGSGKIWGMSFIR